MGRFGIHNYFVTKWQVVAIGVLESPGVLGQELAQPLLGSSALDIP